MASSILSKSYIDLSPRELSKFFDEKSLSSDGLRKTTSLQNITSHLDQEDQPSVSTQSLATRSQSLPAITSSMISGVLSIPSHINGDYAVNWLCRQLVSMAKEQGINLQSRQIEHSLPTLQAGLSDINPKTVRNGQGETVLLKLIQQYTQQTDFEDALTLRRLIDALLESGFDAVTPNHNDENALDFILSRETHVAEQGDLTNLLLPLIEVHHISMDHQGKDGQTPLTRMIQSGESKKAMLLIEQGATPNTKNQKGESPLYLSVLNNQNKVAGALLEKGVRMTVHRYDGGEQALIHFAFDQGDPDMVELLWRHTKDDDIDERNVKNQTVLMRVCELSENETSLEIAQKAIRLANDILDRGANVTLYSKSLESPLIYTLKALLNDTDATCIESRKALANRLIDMGSNHSLQSRDEQTPIRLALAGNHFDIVGHLLQKGATIDERYRNRHTALTQNVFEGNVETVRKLLTQFQANPNTSAQDRLPLQVAVIKASTAKGQLQKQWLEIAELLRNHGANLNLKDKKGNTVLHSACIHCVTDQKESTDIILDLIAHGADINATNSADQLPICHAISARNPVAVKAMSDVKVVTLDVANSLMASGIEEYITELSAIPSAERDQALLNSLMTLRDTALEIIQAHEPATAPSVEAERAQEEKLVTVTEQHTQISIKRLPPAVPKKPAVVSPKQFATATTETSTDQTTAASTGVQTAQEQEQPFNGEKAALKEKLTAMEAQTKQLMEQLRKQSESEAARRAELEQAQSRLTRTDDALKALQAESASAQTSVAAMATETEPMGEEDVMSMTELGDSLFRTAVHVDSSLYLAGFQLMAPLVAHGKTIKNPGLNPLLRHIDENEYDVIEEAPRTEEGASSSNLEKTGGNESTVAMRLMADETRPETEMPSTSSDEE